MDSTALRPLIERHASALRLYARQFCRWPDDAVQEAFIELVRLPNPPNDANAWLFVTVRRRALNQSRAEARRGRREQVVAAEKKDWFEPSLESSSGDDPDLWQQRLSVLPVDQREILVAKIWGEQSFSQIAELTGLSTATVHRRYHAAIEKLRLAISEDESQNTPEQELESKPQSAFQNSKVNQ